MWRAAASRLLLPQRMSAAPAMEACTMRNFRLFSRSPPQQLPAEAEFTTAEALRVVRLVGLEVLKRRLRDQAEEVVGYGEFLDACVETGAVRTHGQADALARAMDQSGDVLLFRGKVYLHPEKVVNLVRSALPCVEADSVDLRIKEFELLKKKKEEIDRLAHKQVRRIMWSGLGFWTSQIGNFLHLTYGEFSWHIMGPIAYFGTGSLVLASHIYFLVTSINFSYQSFMERLFLGRRTRLCRIHGFDMEKYVEMEKEIRCPLGGDYSQAATKEIFGEIERRLRDVGNEMVGHGEVLHALLESGLAEKEAEALQRKVDESNAVLFVRGKAYLNAKKVVDLLKRTVPFALAPEKDARKEELEQLQVKMQEIDELAHKHARRILWCGLAYILVQLVIFFRLTYWEFSWLVIEPFAFFTSGIEIIVCYSYFLYTSRDPTSQNFMERVVLKKKRKLCAKHNFDMDRYIELQKHSRCPPVGKYGVAEALKIKVSSSR